MKQIKIAFFDVDGTLIDMASKRITENTLKTLHTLQNWGIRICLATGRTPVTLPNIPSITFDSYMTFNGGFCYDDRDVIFENPIPADDVRQILENCASIGRPVSIATRDRVTANGYDADLAEYYSFAGIPLEVTEDFPQVVRQPVFQIMLGCHMSDRKILLKNTSGAQITGWWDRAVDIIPALGGKGMGVEKILAHYGLDKSEAIAFGDGNNDLEMLQAVGTGVAMGNGSGELKAVASCVCKPVTEDGVYHYCLENGLLGPI